MKFSTRTAWEPGLNAWAAAAEALRASGLPLYDLTVANPTACGLSLSAKAVLEPLADSRATQYVPDPLGMAFAREAVSAYYRDHQATVSPEQVCLTTSTSEGYSFLFRILCDPGDEVLIARPSYPLFDLLARIEDVRLREYPLFYDDLGGEGWRIDMEALAAVVGTRTRAIVLVHPNNPTGNYVHPGDRLQLEALCAERNLALIVDEVFLDFQLSDRSTENVDVSSFAGEAGCLTFVLSGISKVCALPQMKVSWIVAAGPAAAVGEAMRRLEIVADTFLSLNAPAQCALKTWLGQRQEIQAMIRERVATNLQMLDRRLRGASATRLRMEGGWTSVLRVPRHVDGKEFALAAMQRGVLVQPGEFYGLPPGRCILSLLTDPGVWETGLAKLPV